MRNANGQASAKQKDETYAINEAKTENANDNTAEAIAAVSAAVAVVLA